jgi:hypothetical protein
VPSTAPGDKVVTHDTGGARFGWLAMDDRFHDVKQAYLRTKYLAGPRV